MNGAPAPGSPERAAVAARASAAPMTATEKVLARASGRDRVSAGDIVVTSVDRAVLLDMQFSSTAVQWREPQRVAHPERLAVIIDHAVPAATANDALGARRARAFVARFGLSDFFDVGDHGICHQVIAENGLARPGELLVCSDSHTTAAGAFNCAARGVGTLEMLAVACTGSTWFVVAPTIEVSLGGRLAAGCEGKDVFLALAQRFGSAAGANLEFVGGGIAGLSLHDRRTIATQCVEIDAEFVLFPCDEVVRDHLAARGVPAATGVTADAGSDLAARWELDLAALQPLVARPGGVVDHVEGAGEVGEIRLDQCFIGSCANGHIEDLALAASLLAGRRIARGTRLIVTPASQRVFLEAARRGYLAPIVEAGAVVTNSTCGACFGHHMGVLGDGEVCLTSSTRNFAGRMGSPRSEVWLGSTRTVIASALAGRIADPRTLVARDDG